VNLWQVLVVLVGSAALSWAVVAASIRLAHRVGHLDHPDESRKIQEHPIPKLGGVAVAAAFTLVLVGGLIATGRLGFSLGLIVLIPALAAAFIGFLDDRSSLNPYLRLVLQAGVGVFAWILGNRVGVTGNFIVDAGILVLWVMVIVNGINLLDNSDGLAGTSVAIISLGSAIVAAIFGQQLVALMGVALVGVSIGYLWHNWFPAKVYLGDAGAYFLGTLVALMLVRLKPERAPVWVGIALVLLLALLPLLDTAYVVIKRLRARIHPFTAGRDHMSHVLQGRGASVPISVIALQGLSVLGAGAAVILALAFS
jgi:UDP-GlcNAc:undecaprenyl-phosphate GlcNAc-1-phosphate transferase